MPLKATLPHGLLPIDFRELAGWHDDDHGEALAVFLRSLPGFLKNIAALWPGMNVTTVNSFAGHAHRALNSAEAKLFFETWFQPCLLSTGQGLFTGYYEPSLRGSLEASQEFPVPVYAKPDDLVCFPPDIAQATGLEWGRSVGGRIQPYDTRKDIELGSLADRGRVICWLDNWIDAFFLHVQGSGRISLGNGQTLRLGYAAKSGWPYTSIGAILIERGEIAADDMSMQALRRWLERDERRARELMWQNKSYIFFRELNDLDPRLGALGSAGVQLTPGRSLALDAAVWPLGLPVWLEVALPGENDRPGLRRLMVMQDTGSAITGLMRGDVYWGSGLEAEQRAGHMKSKGKLIALLPRFLPIISELAR